MTTRRHRGLSLGKREALTGYALLLPYTLGFVVFVLLPCIVAVLTSFSNMDFITIKVSKLKFVGFSNYATVLHDMEFWRAFGRSMYYMALYVPLSLALGLLIAYFLNSKIRLRKTIRTLIFLPYVSNIVAIALVWRTLYDYQDGFINSTLRGAGVQNPPMWLLGNSGIVLFSIALVAVWQGLGMTFIVYLAALQEIPAELYEAAAIDGANERQRFMYVTMPALAPTTFFLFITAMITSMQNYAIIQTFTKGGPGKASTTMSLYTYQQSFFYNNMKVGTTQSVLMLVIPLALTAIYWRGQRTWQS